MIAGGTASDEVGFFVRPTIAVGADPTHRVFSTEYFGPFLAVHVYDDGDFDRVLTQVDRRRALRAHRLGDRPRPRGRRPASEALRFAAGNFYVNDKPTGAVVGQQPFGGGRASGTNDKAGSILNLLRWTSPRTLKETLVPPTSFGLPPPGLTGQAPHPVARSFTCAFSAASATRFGPRLGPFGLHDPLQDRAPRPSAGTRPSARGAGGWAANAAARSSGTTRFSTSSSSVHDPSALAASITASPAGAISPAAVSRSMRSLLVRAQPLPRLRGANHSIVRSASSERPLLSTQPKHSACSTDSS